MGSGPVISRGNRAANCRGEAAGMDDVRPAYILTGQITDGTADQRTNGTKKFRCSFDAQNRFVEVMPLDRDGE